MTVDQYLTDEQDPKTAEKILGKLRDMFQKLKGLYERGLISQEEYESKKADLLSRF
jgi:hypothetical protein